MPGQGDKIPGRDADEKMLGKTVQDIVAVKK
jgi:hypothetical protein